MNSPAFSHKKNPQISRAASDAKGQASPYGIVLGLALCLLLTVGCSNSSTGTRSAGSGTGGTTGDAAAATGGGTTGTTNTGNITCNSSAPGCMSSKTNSDGVIIKSCQEYLDPAPYVSILKSTCDEMAADAAPNETVTYLPNGCPKTDDLLGYCLKKSTTGGKTMWSNQHFYEINDPVTGPATHQSLRDGCQTVERGQFSMIATWCAGSLQ